MGRILVVEHDPVARDLLLEVLRGAGHEVRGARSPDEARAAAREFPPHVAVVDVRAAPSDGLSLIVALRELDSATQVIVVTAFGSLHVAVEAVRKGAFDYVSKPFRMDEMRQTVARALEAYIVASEAQTQVQEPAPAILGRSAAMNEVVKAIARAAPLRAAVLLQGETGTGKELVARAIHDASDRSGRPYVTVNCASLPEPLLEAELFGRVQAASPGAAGDRAGLFVEADGGTILLDEIGDLPAGTQAKLLRVLEAGEVRAVGAAQARTVDVRVLAASHRDLSKAVEANRFRSDLFDRLNEVAIAVPPLRSRLEDLPLLVEHLLKKHSRNAGRVVRSVSPEAMRMLERYPWPGNVRELSHVLERAVVMTRGTRIEVEDLPAQFSDAADAVREVPVTASRQTLDEVEKAHILTVLKSVGGNRVRAAAILDIDRKTLYRKLIRWGLQRPEDEEQLKNGGGTT